MAIKRTTSPDGFRFYTIKKKRYPSATTYVRVIPKPFLYPWYANMEKQAVMKLLAKFKGKRLINRLYALAEPKSEIAASKYIQKMSNWGDLIHSTIDAIFTGAKSPSLKPKHKKCIAQFQKWWKRSKLEAVKNKSEVIVHCEKPLVAGTIDLIAKVKGIGELIVCDWKTGAGIYLDHYYQVVMYIMCCQAMGMKVKRGLIVHIPRDGAEVKIYQVIPGEGKAPTFAQVGRLIDFWSLLNANKISES